MEIYLVRHTTPEVSPNICYGQTDLEVTDTYPEELKAIQPLLPVETDVIYSSPLIRCKKLAEDCYTNQEITIEPRIKELNFGRWEMKPWKEIPKLEMDEWMKDFVNNPAPQGESFIDLQDRVLSCLLELQVSGHQTAVVFTHGGVIRSILSHINDTPLSKAFEKYKVGYGKVFHIEL